MGLRHPAAQRLSVPDGPVPVRSGRAEWRRSCDPSHEGADDEGSRSGTSELDSRCGRRLPAGLVRGGILMVISKLPLAPPPASCTLISIAACHREILRAVDMTVVCAAILMSALAGGAESSAAERPDRGGRSRFRGRGVLRGQGPAHAAYGCARRTRRPVHAVLLGRSRLLALPRRHTHRPLAGPCGGARQLRLATRRPGGGRRTK